MEKLKLFLFALATTALLYSCETKRQEGGSEGSGQGQGFEEETTNDVNDLAEDPVDNAEEANENKFESNSAASDAEFMVEAAEGGMFEVEAARLAQSKASSQKVKDFAMHMEKEHSKANDELKALAAQKNVTLPKTLSNDKMEKIQELTNLSGTEFDKEYMDIMVEDHKKDVNTFESEAKGETQGEVEAWAAKTLPVLQNHLEMAKQTKDEVDNLGGNNNNL
ncbi:MAG TPA: DUF4142 domain-containing protein [Cytophagales bacterium]|nr:DUF4142 domain-containing protein [Cytophagales bacterium]